jgi:hypothetical protein
MSVNLITAHECRKLATMNDNGVERQIINLLLQRYDSAIRKECLDGLFEVKLSVPYNMYGFPEYNRSKVCEAVKTAIAANGFEVDSTTEDYVLNVRWNNQPTSGTNISVQTVTTEPKSQSLTQKKIIKLI